MGAGGTAKLNTVNWTLQDELTLTRLLLLLFSFLKIVHKVQI